MVAGVGGMGEDEGPSVIDEASKRQEIEGGRDKELYGRRKSTAFDDVNIGASRTISSRHFLSLKRSDEMGVVTKKDSLPHNSL